MRTICIVAAASLATACGGGGTVYVGGAGPGSIVDAGTAGTSEDPRASWVGDWKPMQQHHWTYTCADGESGGLVVVPGSHRLGVVCGSYEADPEQFYDGGGSCEKPVSSSPSSRQKFSWSSL